MRRWDVLIEFIKNNNLKIGAEIGIFKGKIARRVLNSCNDIQKYYCIDPGKGYENADKVYKNFLKFAKKFSNKIIVKRMISEDAVEEIQDNSLDFLFIDGNHQEEYVKKDIDMWYPKIKNGGLIGGHDYNEEKFMSVVNAVNSRFSKKDLIFKDSHTGWTGKEIQKDE